MSNKEKAFLDTPVLAKYLTGDTQAIRLLSDQMLQKVIYVTSPIVFQELLLRGPTMKVPQNWQDLENRIEILPLDFFNYSQLKPSLAPLRNRLAHSNDALLLGIVRQSDCDYLITDDELLIQEAMKSQLVAMRPEQFLQHLQQSHESLH